MRERLVVAFVGLTLLVLALYGVPRAYYLGDLVRADARAQVDRAAGLAAIAVDERLAAGTALTPAFLDRLAASAEMVRVERNGRTVTSTGAWQPQESDIVATAALSDGGEVTITRSAGEVGGAVREALLPLILIGILLAVLAGLAGFVMARRLARPFQELALAARGLGNGEYRPDLPTYRVPEAQAIGTAITATGQEIDDLLTRERAVTVHASHELRTPVTALRLELEDLALWPETTDAVATELQRCIGELDRLSAAIGDLLVIADVRRQGAEIDLDLDALLADTVDRLQQTGTHATHTPTRPLPTRLEPKPLVEALELLLDASTDVRALDRGTHFEIALIQDVADPAGSPARTTPRTDSTWTRATELLAAVGGQLTPIEQGALIRLPKRATSRAEA